MERRRRRHRHDRAADGTFTAPTLSGESFDLADYAGQDVMLWLWAPCSTPIPSQPLRHDIMRYAPSRRPSPVAPHRQAPP